VPFAFINGLPLLGAAVVFAVVLRGAAGRPRPISPLVFSFFGAGMVFVGIAGNAVYRVGDAQLAGTVFEEGAWIYVCYGLVLGALGGVVYWGPKLWGRIIPDKKVLPLALLGLLATILASFPYYIAGFAKQPANAVEFDYSGPQNLWNILVTAGHALMFLTVLAFVLLAVRSFRSGEHAGDDPWDGQTLEWATSSPAPASNFAELHTVNSPEPLLDLKPVSTEGNA
jgi:heme/copper-type cytochrome/quinol oxidase subunit 1